MDIVSLLNTNAPHTASPRPHKKRRPLHDKQTSTVASPRRADTLSVKSKKDFSYDSRWQSPQPHEWSLDLFSNPQNKMSMPFTYESTPYRGTPPISQTPIPSQHDLPALDASMPAIKQSEHDPDLLQHVQSAEGMSNDDDHAVKTFACSTCRKGFARRSDLVRHGK